MAVMLPTCCGGRNRLSAIGRGRPRAGSKPGAAACLVGAERPESSGDKGDVWLARGGGEAGSLHPLTMSANLAHKPLPQVRVRTAERGDLDALMALEHRVF